MTSARQTIKNAFLLITFLFCIFFILQNKNIAYAADYEFIYLHSHPGVHYRTATCVNSESELDCYRNNVCGYEEYVRTERRSNNPDDGTIDVHRCSGCKGEESYYIPWGTTCYKMVAKTTNVTITYKLYYWSTDTSPYKTIPVVYSDGRCNGANLGSPGGWGMTWLSCYTPINWGRKNSKDTYVFNQNCETWGTGKTADMTVELYVNWGHTNKPTSTTTGYGVCAGSCGNGYACGPCKSGYYTWDDRKSHTGDGGGTTITAATCTAAGKRNVKCTRCGSNYTTTSIPALGHNPTQKVTTATGACAGSAGYYKCTRCSYTERAWDDRKSHTGDGGGTTITAATCTAAGKRNVKCTRCGSNYTTTSIPALGHNPTQKTTTATGPCSGSTGYYKCTRCSYTERAWNDYKDHNWETKTYGYGACSGSYGEKVCKNNSAHKTGAWDNRKDHTWPSDYAYGTDNNISNGVRYKNCTVCSTRLITQYAVYLNKDSVISSVSGQNWYTAGSKVTIDAGTITAGYSWSQWTGSVTNSTKNLVLTNSINRAYSLTAKATPNKYTVTLNNQNATVAGSTGVTATYAAAMPSLTAPTKSYTISYNGNGGTVSPASTTMTFTFGGYFTAANGGGTKYYNADKSSARNYDIVGNTTLYAKWTKPSNATLPTPSRPGYTFTGWFTASSGGTKIGMNGSAYNPYGDTDAVSNITLYAQWTPNKHGISYELNGGVYGASHPTEATYDSAFTVSNPTRTGFTFVGWTITGMDSCTHTIGAGTSTATSLDYTTVGVNTTFKNLRQTSGTVVFTAVWKDTVNPAIGTTLTYPDGTIYTEGTWTNKSITLSASASDNGSGVKKIAFEDSILASESVNASQYTKTIPNTSEGVHTGSVTVYDNADTVNNTAGSAWISNGNYHTTSKAFTVKTDYTKPVINTYVVYGSSPAAINSETNLASIISEESTRYLAGKDSYAGLKLKFEVTDKNNAIDTSGLKSAKLSITNKDTNTFKEFPVSVSAGTKELTFTHPIDFNDSFYMGELGIVFDVTDVAGNSQTVNWNVVVYDFTELALNDFIDGQEYYYAGQTGTIKYGVTGYLNSITFTLPDEFFDFTDSEISDHSGQEYIQSLYKSTKSKTITYTKSNYNGDAHLEDTFKIAIPLNTKDYDDPSNTTTIRTKGYPVKITLAKEVDGLLYNLKEHKFVTQLEREIVVYIKVKGSILSTFNTTNK